MTPSTMTWPSTRAPGMVSCMRLRVRRKVDFPQPEGPMRAVTDLGSIDDVDVLHGQEVAVVDVLADDVDAL